MTRLNWAKVGERDRIRRHGAESTKGASWAPLGQAAAHAAAKVEGCTPRKSLPEPVFISEFWANRRGESVRIQLREFEGLALVDVRKHYTAADGKMLPTKKGLSIAIARLPDLAAAINKAVVKAIELGLIKDGVL